MRLDVISEKAKWPRDHSSYEKVPLAAGPAMGFHDIFPLQINAMINGAL